MADLLEVLAKLKIDVSDYKKGLKEADSDTSKASNDMKQSFVTVQQAISSSTSFLEAMRNGHKATSTEMKNTQNTVEALRRRIEMLKTSYAGSKAEVGRLSGELNKSIKETGTASDETIKLAVALTDAEKKAKEDEQTLKGLEDELKKYGKQTDEVAEKSTESGEKIKHAFGVVAKAGVEALETAVKLTAKAVTAAAGGVAFLVKSSVSAYGEYEQLAGGAKKIFDEMDFTIIKTDARNAFKELNMSINDYIEAINLAGATFSQTMGDQAAYNTARKGMLAISDFATGTGKSVDELTQKYQMITRAASSYQSIADQFAGILPQTSADFLKQAQAAGFLSEKYEKLTEVPVAEYQRAVTDMLSKGVADLGLANNALKESEGTLTGSMAMTKAAWENLVMSLANGDDYLVGYINDFVDAASASFSNMLPLIEQALNGVSLLIEKIVPQIMDEIGNMMGDGGVLQNLLDAGKNIIESIAKGIEENMDTVISFAENILDMFLDTLETVLPTLTTLGIKILSTLGSAIIDNLDTILETAGLILQEIITGLSEHAGDILDAAVLIIESLGKFIIDNADMLIDSAVQIVLTLIQGVEEHASDIVSLAINILSALASSLLENSAIIIEALPELIQGFFDAFLSEENLSKMIEAWIGLMDTLEEALPQVTEAILDAIPKLMDALVEYFVGGGAEQLFRASVIMFGYMTKALGRAGLEILAQIGTHIREWWTQVQNAASEFGTAAKTAFQALITAAIEKFTELKTKISEKVSNIVQAVKDKFSNLAQMARTWARDMISNFISGITDKFSALKDKVSSVADLFKSYIGHSHPTEGAMADDYKWMPDMMDLFIKGISDNENELRKTVNKAFDFEDAITAPTMQTANIGQGRGMTDSIDKLLSSLNINLYNTTEIDGKEIKKDSYKYTVQRLGDETRAVKIAMGGY